MYDNAVKPEQQQLPYATVINDEPSLANDALPSPSNGYNGQIDSSETTARNLMIAGLFLPGMGFLPLYMYSKHPNQKTVKIAKMSFLVSAVVFVPFLYLYYLLLIVVPNT